MTNRIHRTSTLVFLAAGLTASASAQSNLTTYVSIGDSLAAGFSSGSLVETNQATSVPALIARQAGVADFQQPLVSEPGIPTQLTLVSLTPTVIAPKSASQGVPKNLGLGRPYNNLAVPGATSIDALTTLTDNGGLNDLILRGRGTQVQQAASLRPTFVTVWIGNNDVLGAAVRGQAIDGVTLTPTATFRQVYGQIIAALKATGAGILAANLPDVTTIPYVTTIKPYVVSPTTGQPVVVNGNTVPLIGPNGPLPPGTLVTLAASTYLARGVGVPAAAGGTGQPLPDQVILDANEVAIIRAHVDADNQAIKDICGAAGIPIFDLHTLLQQVATEGYAVGGVKLTNAFLTGGIFSYDGVHPNALGYAVVANEWIKAIDATGGSLPLVDLAPFMGLASSAAGTSPPAALGVERIAAEFTPEAYAALLAAFPRLDGKP